MKTIIFSFILILLAQGCRKSNDSSNVASNEIFPGKVGDTWRYLVYDTTTGGGSSQYYVDVSIISDTTLAGGIQATMWKYQYPNFADTSFVILKGDTIRYLSNTNNLSLIKQYVIPFSVNSSLPNPLCDHSQVRVSERSGVAVGQTYFLNSFHLTSQSGCPDFSFVEDEWMVNNIGLVQSYFNPSGSFIVATHITKWLLMRYNLK